MIMKFVLTILITSFTLVVYSFDICYKNRVSFYFESNSYALLENDKLILDSLSATLKGDMYIELHGFTDSIGKLSSNQTLSESRAKSVAKYLNLDSVKIIGYGESASGIYSNVSRTLTEDRRVDLILIPTINNRIRITGQRNSFVDIPVESFTSKSICDCQLKLDEIKSDQEAFAKGIPLVTVDDVPLTTAGVVKIMPNECLSNKCIDSIKVTLPWGKNDPEMTSWVSTNTENGLRWFSVENAMNIDTVSGSYIMTIPCEFWTGNNYFNADKPIRKYNLEIPLLDRGDYYIEIEPQIDTAKVNDTIFIYSNSQLTDTTLFFDIGINKNRDIFYLVDTLVEYRTNQDSIRLPLGRYSKLIYSDTLLILKTKMDIQLRTYIEGEKVFLDNNLFIVKGNFLDKLFNLTRYEIPLPKTDYYFTLENKKTSPKDLNFRLKKRRQVYKCKIKETSN